jgi:hypothetical protein
MHHSFSFCRRIEWIKMGRASLVHFVSASQYLH